MIEQINNAGHCIKKVAQLMTLQIAIFVISCCFAPIMIDSSSSATIMLFSIVVLISQLVLLIKIITNLSNAGEYLLDVVKEIPKKNDVVISSKPINNTTMKPKDYPKNTDEWIDEFV